MVPRTEIEAVEMEEGVSALKEKFIRTQLSRIVVYLEDIDHIKGYVHHNDLFKNPASLVDLVRPMPAVPESMSARELLNILRRDRKNMAWVVDEFGGTAGLVTMEDILEEIFGEIKDEHDTDDLVEKKLSDVEYIFAGRLEIDYLNDKYNLALPTGDYKTLTGLILFYHERIPSVRTMIHTDKYDFEILSVNGKMIDTVRVKKTEG
jgi:CBS domain containing-hemolysin-like protein